MQEFSVTGESSRGTYTAGVTTTGASPASSISIAAIVEAAEHDAIGRKATLEQLAYALAGRNCGLQPLPAVFVYGPTGSGKTHTVVTLLKVGVRGIEGLKIYTYKIIPVFTVL